MLLLSKKGTCIARLKYVVYLPVSQLVGRLVGRSVSQLNNESISEHQILEAHIH